MAVTIKKMLVSQPQPESSKSPYFDIAKKYGVEIEFRPFVKIEPLSAKEFRQQKISILDYSAVIFRARTAVDHFFNLCDELRLAIPESMKYFCMTETIAVYLQKYIIYRKRKVFYGTNGHIEDLVKLVGKHPKEKYLIPVSDVNKGDMLLGLTNKRIHYQNVVMYRTVVNDFIEEDGLNYDILLFFSPSEISSLMKNFPQFNQKNICIGCFGPATAKAALDAGLRLDIEAPKPEAPSMTTALELYLQRASEHKK